MGLFDLLKPGSNGVGATRAALDEAAEAGGDQGAVAQLVEKLLAIGIDGNGAYSSAVKVAEAALTDAAGDRDQAVNRIIRQHVVSGGIGGVATSIGGFVTMPVALPVNLFEFYVQAARMVAAVAVVRGYDVTDDTIRTAVLLTMVGSNSDEVLAKAGVTTGTGRLASLAAGHLPRSAMMIINKAVGFRLLRTVGESAASRLGRAVPLFGGAVGGAIDGYMMHRIAEQARQEFPRQG